MSFAKNFVLSIINLLLITSLSVFVMSLAFTLTINERSLNALVEDNLEPFIDKQIDKSFEDMTTQEIESRHKSALLTCQTKEFYEIGSQDENVISMDCDEVRSTTSNQFFAKMKSAIKGHTMNAVTKALNKSAGKLKYATYVLWTSIVLSIIFIVTIILVAWGFPFKTFGATSLIAGSPFIILLISKPFIAQKIQQAIQNTVPPEIFEQLSQSTLIDEITNLISNLFFDMVVGFATLFFLGSILLVIGLLIKKKKPETQQFSQQFIQPQQYQRPTAKTY